MRSLRKTETDQYIINTAIRELQAGTINDFVEFKEITAPVNGPANTGRLFVRDNGAGKSQLCIIFATGVVQVIVTEP